MTYNPQHYNVLATKTLFNYLSKRDSDICLETQIKAGADPNQLNIVISHNRLEDFKALLDAGASPNLAYDYGYYGFATPLAFCILAKRYDMMEILLKHPKIDIEEKQTFNRGADYLFAPKLSYLKLAQRQKDKKAVKMIEMALHTTRETKELRTQRDAGNLKALRFKL